MKAQRCWRQTIESQRKLLSAMSGGKVSLEQAQLAKYCVVLFVAEERLPYLGKRAADEPPISPQKKSLKKIKCVIIRDVFEVVWGRESLEIDKSINIETYQKCYY